MELRSCGNYHFIKAIKGGSINNIMNVSHGKPTLVFKNVKDLYESDDTEKHSPLSKYLSEPELENLGFEYVTVKVEGPSLPTLEKRTIRCSPETFQSNEHGGHDGGESYLDNLSFGEITLQQIKKRCKSKKRKHSSKVSLTEETVEICYDMKQEFSKCQAEEDENDLLESLSSLKTKLLKKTNCKRKFLGKQFSIPSQSALSVVKSEPILSNQDFLECQGVIPPTIDLKVEFSEPDHLDRENMICAANDDLFGDASVEVPESDYSDGHINKCVAVDSSFGCTVNVGFVEGEISESNKSDGRTITRITKKSSFGYHDDTHSSDTEFAELHSLHGQNLISVAGNSSFGCDEHVETSEFASSEVPKKANECVPEEEISVFSSKEFQSCTYNEVCYDYLELAAPKSVPNARPLGREFTEAHSPEVSSHLCSELLVFELKDESCITDEMTCQTNSITWIQGPDTVTCNSLESMEHNHIDISCRIEGATKDDLPTNIESSSTSTSVSKCISSRNCSPCSSPDICLVNVSDDSRTSEDKEPLMPALDNAVRSCSTENCLSADIGELTISSGIGNNDCFELQHSPPQRIPSTRKVISPTSQERLCKAMAAAVVHDTEAHYKPMGKVYTGKQIPNKINRFKCSRPIRRHEVAIIRNKMIRKPKNGINCSNHKGLAKVPHLSHALPQVSNGCTSVQNYPHSAIKFSQRQMQDIECLTAKLTKELTSMKGILEDSLHPENYHDKSLKYHATEVRTAIANATKAEETAKRWISIMTRDCNRFCKIMNLTQKGSGSPENVIHKKSKKIRFADEAGGKLCHVKLIEDDMVSLLETNTENQELLA